jgi:hypothetical protein
VPAGHAHPEDALQDRRVVEWLDTTRLRGLAGTIGEAEIQDPNARSYTEGVECRSRFRFRPTAGRPEA